MRSWYPGPWAPVTAGQSVGGTLRRVNRSGPQITVAVLAAAALAGCGDSASEQTTTSGDGESTSTATPEPTGTAQSETSAAPLRLRHSVRETGGKRQSFGPKVTLSTGRVLQVRTEILNPEPLAGAKLRIRIPRKLGSSAAVTTATPLTGGTERSAKIEVAGSGGAKLDALRYVCTVEPKTFCPAEQATARGSAYELVFPVPPKGVPIVVFLDVGRAGR